MKVSDYNIYVELDDKKDVIIQGYRGSFDIVDKEITGILKHSEKEVGNLKKLDSNSYEILLNRGYITNKDRDQELDSIQKISKTINKYMNNLKTITIMPTYNCNFRCEYCFEQDIFKNNADKLKVNMSKELIDSIFSQLIDFKLNNEQLTGIHLFGGEPLLKNNKEIVSYICQKSRELDLPISCISNGYDLDKYIDILKDYSFYSTQITIDGIGEEHNSRRYLVGKQGTYDKIMENINLALNNNINIVVRTNVNKKNIHAIEPLIEEYSNRGWLDKPNFSYYFKSTLQCYDDDDDMYSDVELMEKLSNIMDVNKNKFEFNTIYNGLYQSLSSMIESKGIAPLRSGYCGANYGMYTIDPFGDIYPCWDVLLQEECKIGYVDKEHNKFIFNKTHNDWKNRTVDQIDDCKNCEYLLFCGGGCSAQAKVMNGNMNKVFCDRFPEIFNEVVKDMFLKNKTRGL